MARSSSTSGLEALTFFIVGGLAGAALALVLAPDSGEGTRRLLRSRMRGLVGSGAGDDGEDPERGEVIFSNRPEPAADVVDPLKRGETLGDVASS